MSSHNKDGQTADPLALLFDHHRRELLEKSAIAPDVAAERGYRSINRPGVNDDSARRDMKRLGFPTWALKENYYFPGLLIPVYRATGERISAQLKPAAEIPTGNGKRVKYVSVKGQSSVLDVHPRWSKDRGTEDPSLVPFIRDVNTPLFITEGIKKADALTSRGLCTVALNGVYNWRSTLGTLGDWEDIPLRGRALYIVFDADAVTNRNVLRAMQRIGKWLRSKGAEQIQFIVPPAQHNGKPSKGADDFFAAGGTADELLARATAKPPEGLRGEDRFTDARMAETIADEVLVGKFIQTAGLGWLQWDGRRWCRVDEGAPLEATRQHAIAQYCEALDELRRLTMAGENTDLAEGEVDGWHKLQASARLRAVLGLAGGIDGVLKDAADFDRDPDVLNTPGGIVDLATGAVHPHDPDQLMTRITGVDYIPGADDEAFKAILGSIPDGCETYLQLRLGQAVTGYTPDDDRLVMLSGEGANGKTALMDCVFTALGGGDRSTGYAALVPNALLLAGKTAGAATPEKMTIRGVRLAYVEETPEGRHLDVQALKEVIGTPTIEGRHLYKDIVTFGATHSMFLNTNHPPVVSETDNATWRRLKRIEFPYRFRRPGDDLGEWRELDRNADPTLKARLRERSAQEAALAWLIEGAIRWYAADRSLDSAPAPIPVEAATRKWRLDSDVILRFIEDRMEYDAEAWTPTQVLYEEFRDWTKAQGQVPPALPVLVQRVKGHTGLSGVVSVRRVSTATAGMSMPGGGSTDWLGEDSRKPVGKQAMAVVGVRFRRSDE